MIYVIAVSFDNLAALFEFDICIKKDVFYVFNVIVTVFAKIRLS